MKSLIKQLAFLLLLVSPVAAVEIINNTSKIIHVMSFVSGDNHKLMLPLEIKPREKKIQADCKYFHVNIPELRETYVFEDLDKLICVTFIEFDNAITFIESREAQGDISTDKHATNPEKMEKQRELKAVAEQREIEEQRKKRCQFFKEHLRQNHEEIKKALDSFDKQNDQYYRYGVQLGYHALKIAHRYTFFDKLTPEQIEQDNKQLVQELERIAELIEPSESWTKLLKERKTVETQNMYNKWLLGLTSVYESDQILDKSLEYIGCPEEKIKTVIESGNCQMFLWRMMDGMIVSTADEQLDLTFDTAYVSSELKENIKKYLRQNYEELKTKLGSFDKENDQYYRYGVQQGYHALKISQHDNFFDKFMDEQFMQDLAQELNIEFKEVNECWTKLLNERKTIETQNMYNKWLLGLISVYESDQILEKSLEHIGCPEKKIKAAIESGNCQICLWNMMGGMIFTTTQCLLLQQYSSIM